MPIEAESSITACIPVLVQDPAYNMLPQVAARQTLTDTVKLPALYFWGFGPVACNSEHQFKLRSHSKYQLTPACSLDGNFSEQHFRDIVNNGLANTVGNMLNRTLGLLRKYCDGKLPCSAVEAAAEDHPLRMTTAEKVGETQHAYASLAPHAAIIAVVAIAARGNLYLEETAPWTALKKVGADACAHLQVTVYTCTHVRCQITHSSVTATAFDFGLATPHIFPSEHQVVVFRLCMSVFGG